MCFKSNSYVRASGNFEGLVLTYFDSADKQVACGREELTKEIINVQFHNIYSLLFYDPHYPIHVRVLLYNSTGFSLFQLIIAEDMQIVASSASLL